MTTGSLTGVMGVARRQRTRRSAGGPSSRGVASLNSAGVGRWRWVSEGRQRPLVDGLESPDLHPGLQGVQPMAGVRATRRHAADRQPHVSSTVTGKVRQDFGLERNAGFGNRGGALKLPPSGGSIQEEPLGDQGRIRGGDTLPRTERAAREVLSLPIYPELSDEDVRTVISAVRSF